MTPEDHLDAKIKEDDDFDCGVGMRCWETAVRAIEAAVAEEREALADARAKAMRDLNLDPAAYGRLFEFVAGFPCECDASVGVICHKCDAQATLNRLRERLSSAESALRASEAQGAAMRAILELIADTCESAVHHHESKGKGGQQCGYHGDFANIVPSTLNTLRRWSEMCRALGIEPKP